VPHCPFFRGSAAFFAHENIPAMRSFPYGCILKIKIFFAALDFLGGKCGLFCSIGHRWRRPTKRKVSHWHQHI
jgi:hypothetical protein